MSAALLEVQQDDLRIYGIEDKLEALMPRLSALEGERKRAEDALSKVRQQVEVEEKRQRDLQDRLRQHRELRDKSEGLLGQVTSPREAAAAMAQIEQAKRFIADDERDLETLGQRLSELRKSATERDQAVGDIQRVQVETRTSLDADRASLEKELKEAHADRASQGPIRAAIAPAALRPHPPEAALHGDFSTARTIVRTL